MPLVLCGAGPVGPVASDILSCHAVRDILQAYCQSFLSEIYQLDLSEAKGYDETKLSMDASSDCVRQGSHQSLSQYGQFILSLGSSPSDPLLHLSSGIRKI